MRPRNVGESSGRNPFTVTYHRQCSCDTAYCRITCTTILCAQFIHASATSSAKCLDARTVWLSPCTPAILVHVSAAKQSLKGLAEGEYKSGVVINKYTLSQSYHWSHRSRDGAERHNVNTQHHKSAARER